jgi:hypothetical protein
MDKEKLARELELDRERNRERLEKRYGWGPGDIKVTYPYSQPEMPTSRDEEHER